MKKLQVAEGVITDSNQKSLDINTYNLAAISRFCNSNNADKKYSNRKVSCRLELGKIYRQQLSKWKVQASLENTTIEAEVMDFLKLRFEQN